MTERMTAEDRPMLTGDVLADVLPKPGRYACNGDCNAVLERPGVCDACAKLRAQRAQDRELAAALASIPLEFRWACADAPELRARVPRLQRATDLPARVRTLALEPKVLLYGASRAGKTSLACAMLRAVIDAGRYPAGAAAWETAKRARFIAARTLAPFDRRDSPDPDDDQATPRRVAARSSVLLIDDVGQEAGDGYRANDRSKQLKEVLEDRHDDHGRIIVTTFANQDAWRAMYGDGVAGRYWDASRVKVVRL